MQTTSPIAPQDSGADILVKSPDGEYLLVVEVKTKNHQQMVRYALDSIRRAMVSFDCSLGLVVAGDRVILLRDSLAEYNGASIEVVGESRLPLELLPPADPQWQGQEAIEFESRVQNWLEGLKIQANVDKLPADLKILLNESVIFLLNWGEIRAAGYRWSKLDSDLHPWDKFGLPKSIMSELYSHAHIRVNTNFDLP
jgi:hypothetical protein